MSIIEARGGGALSSTTTVIVRLLTLVALVLMPFGMTAAPAHGGPIAHAVTADGCDGNENQDEAPVTPQSD